MAQVFEWFLARPQILIGLAVVVVLLIIISAVKRFIRFAVSLMTFFFIFGFLGGTTIQNKYNFSYKENVLTLTVEEKEVVLDFNKLNNAKINAQEDDSFVKLFMVYDNGEKDEVTIPYFLYSIIKPKIKLSN